MMTDDIHFPDVLRQVQWKDDSDGESVITEELDVDSSKSDMSDDPEYTGSSRCTEGRRISEVLRGWMPDYVVKSIKPYKSPDKEPLYSATLGVEPRIKRVPSTESLDTQLSLLSCSTYDRKPKTSMKKHTKKKERPQTEASSTGSKWMAFANRRQGAFDLLLRQQSAHAPTMNFSTNITAFDMMDQDEQKLLLQCGVETGIKMAPGLKRSESNNNLARNARTEIRRYSQTGVGAQRNLGDFKEFQKLNRQCQLKESTNPSSANSRHSLKVWDKNQQATNADVTISKTPTIRTVTPPFKEKVRMWQADENINGIDMNRGMSAKVKNRIVSTTMALERASCQRPNSTPGCLRTDPSNPQNIRISPELSSVIKQDIKLRMGRPRYHEIRKRDVQIWDRGYDLDRSHRNLKVFNWLHSLKEDEFESGLDKDVGVDTPSTRENECVSVMHVHVEAVDEPNLKPLNFEI